MLQANKSNLMASPPYCITVSAPPKSWTSFVAQYGQEVGAAAGIKVFELPGMWMCNSELNLHTNNWCGNRQNNSRNQILWTFSRKNDELVVFHVHRSLSNTSGFFRDNIIWKVLGGFGLGFFMGFLFRFCCCYDFMFLLSVLTEFSANDHCEKDNYGLC